MSGTKPKTVQADQSAGGAAHSVDIEVAPLEALSWQTGADVEASINTLYHYAEASAQESIAWYWNAKRPKARWSQFLRLAAIALATLGGLAPIIASLDWFSQSGRLVGQLGYISLGLAAACVGLDKFFGFSSAWMRYVTTAMALQEELSAFRMDWAKLSAQSHGQTSTPDEVQDIIQRVKDFVQVIDQIVEQETKAWVVEFQANLANIERIAAKSEKPCDRSD